MNKFKNVLTVSPYYKFRKGGIASVIEVYKKYFAKDFNYLPSIYFQNKYLSTIFFPINVMFLFAKLWGNSNLKIIHIHGSHGGSFFRKLIIFWIAKKVFKRRVIYHLHSSDFKIFYNESSIKVKEKIRYLIENVDLVIVLSEEWEVYINSTFTPKKIKVVENIVEKQKGVNSEVNEIGQIDLLFLGRIGNRKGVFDLIESISIMDDSIKKKVHLTIGGDGEVDELKRRIEELNLKNVQFVGWVKGLQKEDLLRKCDVFVLPSYNEGLPISLLEAMSYGKPIISTNVGGIPRILEHKTNGLVIEPGNKDKLKEAIESYLNDSQMVSIHGEKGLEKVEEYYPESVIKKLNIIYEGLL